MNDRQFIVAAYAIILRFPGQFRKGFDDWLWDNVSVQRAFEAEALAVAATKRTHYSAYTIVEYLRHHTMLRSTNDEFKVNQAWTSSMARLFAHMNPPQSELLKFRNRIGAVVAPFSLV